jgi:hypothetical protein
MSLLAQPEAINDAGTTVYAGDNVSDKNINIRKKLNFFEWQ